MFPRRVTFLSVALALWIGGIVAGFCALQQHAGAPGAAQRMQVAGQSVIAEYRQSGRALIVMAAHPRCPCTQASLAELGDLLARSRGACDALVLSYRPEDAGADWPAVASELSVGGVTVKVIADQGGKIAKSLGAETSGHAVFVDAAGRMRFQGGLTVSRGHRGQSPGQTAILEILEGRAPSLTASSVYGCSLERCGSTNDET